MTATHNFTTSTGHAFKIALVTSGSLDLGCDRPLQRRHQQHQQRAREHRQLHDRRRALSPNVTPSRSIRRDGDHRLEHGPGVEREHDHGEGAR